MGILSAMVAAECISYENAIWIAATMAEIHMDSYWSNPKKYVSQKLYKVSHEQLDHFQAYWKEKSRLPVYVLEHDPQVQTLLQYAEEDQEMMQEICSQFNITGSRIAYFPSAAHTPRTQEKALKLQALFLSDNPFIAPNQGILLHTQSLRQSSAFLHTTSMLKQELFDISTGRIDLSRLFNLFRELSCAKQDFFVIEIGTRELMHALSQHAPMLHYYRLFHYNCDFSPISLSGSLNSCSKGERK
jgi:hypothetical protein